LETEWSEVDVTLSGDICCVSAGVHAIWPKNRAAEVRAFIKAWKSVKADGAKEGRKMDCVKCKRKEKKSVSVQNAKQAEETCDEWSWVEPAVWTERMLNTLETGVKGGKWFSLIDKVYKPANLEASFKSVKSNKGAAGTDKVTIAGYEKHLEHNLHKLGEQLSNGQYEPQAVKRCYIEKSGGREKRPLGIPAVRDRVVQKALCNVLEPIFEHGFYDDSYGFRPGRGCKDALREVYGELKSGKEYVLDVDLKSFFDTIDHELLMTELEKKISDGRVLELIRKFLKQEVLEESSYWKPENGTPQGGVLSPLLANIFLNELDWLIPKAGVRMIRYADDFVVLCRSSEEAEIVLSRIREWCKMRKLILHPEKTRIVNMGQNSAYFEFLGYRFKRTQGKGKIIRVPRQRSVKSLRDKVRNYTKRANGHSLARIIESINPVLNGWYEYYKHSHKSVHWKLDGWIRMRLRSILRKRAKRKGCGNRTEHYHYPNEYFHKLKLFSLEQAWTREVQSLRC
jgi:RNA-directed DNA polymerase